MTQVMIVIVAGMSTLVVGDIALGNPSGRSPYNVDTIAHSTFKPPIGGKPGRREGAGTR